MKVAKNIMIGVAISLICYVIFYIFKDKINAFIDKYILKNTKELQDIPSQGFITTFGNCKLNDIDLNAQIDINNQDLQTNESCNIGYLQTRLNKIKGENLLVNGKLDGATRDALLAAAGSNVFDVNFVSVRTLKDWLSYVG